MEISCAGCQQTNMFPDLQTNLFATIFIFIALLFGYCQDDWYEDWFPGNELISVFRLTVS